MWPLSRNLRCRVCFDESEVLARTSAQFPPVVLPTLPRCIGEDIATAEQQIRRSFIPQPIKIIVPPLLGFKLAG